MSTVLSLRIPDEMAARLDRLARRYGNGATRSRVSLRLLDESLREAEFALIDFRDSVVGRQAYMKGSRLQVWMVIMVAKEYAMDVAKVSEHFQRPTDFVQAAFNYYAAYKDEIDLDIASNNTTYEDIRKTVPSIQLFEVNTGSTTNGVSE